MRKTTIIVAGLVACLIGSGCAIVTPPPKDGVWVKANPETGKLQGPEKTDYEECIKIAGGKQTEFAKDKCPRSYKHLIEKAGKEAFAQCMRDRGFREYKFLPTY